MPVSYAASSVPCSIWRASSSGNGAIQPASANSAVHVTSSSMMSTAGSPATSLRASWSRWSSAALGSVCCSIVYRPPAASVHAAAPAA
ncbi:hypothetical protein BJF78_23905 [Pseudonocardia sp. CNS-139]|nr:hypothetical protein BJF78_23905 [Pseudonocardia sp. CNS-139]